MTCQEYNNTGESDEKYLEGEHHDLTTYYQIIKKFEYLLESENYQDRSKELRIDINNYSMR